MAEENTIRKEYNKLSEKTGKLEQTILGKRKRILRQLLNTGLILISIAILSLFNFKSFSLDFSKFLQSSYWATVGIKSMVLTLAFTAGTNILYDREVDNNKLLQGYMAEYMQKIKLLDDNFQEYIETVLNVQIKKEFWIKTIQNKLYHLEKKRHRGEKWVAKRKKYKEQITEEWIKENLDEIRLNCPRINWAVFSMSINGNAEMHSYKVTSHEAANRSKKTISSIIKMVLVSAGLSLLMLSDASVSMTDATVNLVINLLWMIWQIFRGITFTPQLIESELTLPYANRLHIINSYLTWNANNPESKAKKITDYINTLGGTDGK